MNRSFDRFNITIVGAGMIGLAIARSLTSTTSTSIGVKGASTRNKLLILEKNTQFGEETSARNSEVIHAGIYYPAGSLKAKYCVLGKTLLYAYCKKHNTQHRTTGKLIVATHQDELEILESIRINAHDNGVTDLSFISENKLSHMEPNVNAVGALFSPSTGIVNSHQLMTQFLAETESKGALFVPRTEVTAVSPHADGLLVRTRSASGENYSFVTSILVNAAGLGAQSLANNIEGIRLNSTPTLHYCKGSYFSLSGKSPFQHLIYPVPSDAGLGIHATIDLGGQVKFGPNTQYCDQLDYSMNESNKSEFERAIKRYFPALDPRKLNPAFSGIRPKLQGPEDDFKDFVIQTKAEHNVPGLIQLFGLESPGLTSSLAIGETVAQLIQTAL